MTVSGEKNKLAWLFRGGLKRGIQSGSWRRLMLAAVAGSGIALSAILAVHFLNMQIEVKRYQLAAEAMTFTDDLEQYLQNRVMIAKTVGALFEAPELSTPHPLGSVGKKILALVPEIRLLAWIPQVDPSHAHEVLSALSAAGGPAKLFGPSAETEDISGIGRVLYPVVDIEPKADNNQVGLGMDVGLFPSRRAAYEQARDEKRVIATAPLELLKPFQATGYIVYGPVYSERGFVGCIMFAFRVDQLLNGFAHGRRVPMNFSIYDKTDAGKLTYLVDVSHQGEVSAGHQIVSADDPAAVLHSLEFAGRKLLVFFDPRPDLVQVGMQQAVLVGSIGLILTGIIICGMYYFMRSSRRLAFEIATSNSMKASLELMNRELVHRVGNLLAVAQGIIQLSYNASLSAVEFKDSILARLQALNQSVRLINREDWRGVLLYELLKLELLPVVDRIDLSGRDVLLKPKAAQSLSLLFYELMTNSSKHGALSKSGGRVTAEWETKDSEAGRLFCFRWREHDNGITSPPTRQGFGTTLLTRLVPGDLLGRATLNYESGWFIYELEAPVERVVEQETNVVVNVKAFVPALGEHSDANTLPQLLTTAEAN
jgi:two-component sensor histidine kinase